MSELVRLVDYCELNLNFLRLWKMLLMLLYLYGLGIDVFLVCGVCKRGWVYFKWFFVFFCVEFVRGIVCGLSDFFRILVSFFVSVGLDVS